MWLEFANLVNEPNFSTFILVKKKLSKNNSGAKNAVKKNFVVKKI